MKKIVCELCEGTEFTKDNGMFVCQGCGTKYSAEEARALMREVEGDSAPAPSAPAVSNNQQLDNILLLANSAYEADNKAEAENYCNQAIVLDAACYKAWFLKGKAVGWQSSIGNLRIEEAAHSFCKALDFAPEDEKESLTEQAAQELKSLGIALISLRKNRFSSDPSESELAGFTTDRTTVINALLILVKHGYIVGIPEGYQAKVATLMNEAGVAALNMMRKAWGKIDHPSDKDLTTLIDWCSNIETLFRQAIEECDDDDEADIVRYKNIAVILEEPIGMYSHEQYWDTFWNEYRWRNKRSLTSEAVQSRRESAAAARKVAQALEEKVAARKKLQAELDRQAAEEEKKKRIEEYWQNHPQEKATLEAEKETLKSEGKKIEDRIVELDKKIRELEQEKKEKLPSELEEDKLCEQKKALENEKSQLGLFAGKEKKRLAGEIAALEDKIAQIREKVSVERKARSDEFNAKIEPVKEQRNLLAKELDTIDKRVAEIDKEFKKDRE